MSFDFEKTVMYLIIPYLSLLQNLLEEQEEDLFLFGYVRSMIGIVAMYLNPRFTYDLFSIQRWLSSLNDLRQFPYIFAAMNGTEEEYITLTSQLWQKTKSIHNH